MLKDLVDFLLDQAVDPSLRAVVACSNALRSLELRSMKACVVGTALPLVKLTLALLVLILLLALLLLLSSFLWGLISPQKRFIYESKHAVVTGGSSGIGLALAEEYLRNGCNVTIVARDKKKLKAALQSLQDVCLSLSSKVAVMAASIDVTSSSEEFSSGLKDAMKKFGAVDVLVNCAGSSVAAAFDDLAEGDFEKMLRLNVLGSVYPTRAVLAGMKDRGEGRIVFVASQVAHVAIHGYTAYAASKWALRGLAEALQMEVKPFNIFVSVAYPPDTDTPGYALEMQSKPQITKKISESGQVFNPKVVAKDIVYYSAQRYFGVSTGLDGYLMKQLHPGFSPVNSAVEVVQQMLLAPVARAISVVYLLLWDWEVDKHVKATAKSSAAFQKKDTKKKR